MTTRKPPSIEERLQQIQEALDEKPDRADAGYWSCDLEFKLEQIHDDVSRLQDEVAEVKDKVDDLQSEDR
jgi:hypothetical protein